MKKILFLIIAILPFLSNAQNMMKNSSNEYSENEQKSALLINTIEKKLFGSNPNFDSLSIQLESIISNKPANYVNTFEKNGQIFIKFWNEAEYDKYMEIEKLPVVRIQNVYPYACYLLAIIKIERGLFEDAFSVLKFGLELEPNQPTLINELAFLYTEIASTTKDTSFFNQSNLLFQKAFSSRTYNTNSQKARSLRGIGYNLIELGDFKNSLINYEKSLEYEESKTARNEINLIKDKLSNESINIYSKGTNLDKSEKVYSLEYFIEQENKLPNSIKEKIPNKYVYLWSKASLYLSGGSESFRNEDYFKYPLKEWDIDQIDAGVIQIVQFLKGVSPEYYIELNSITNVEQLMLTFHFVKQSDKKLNDNIFEITFEHKMDKDKIILFFKLKK
jgi:tetratricopeptide (TPR) repeat protein